MIKLDLLLSLINNNLKNSLITKFTKKLKNNSIIIVINESLFIINIDIDFIELIMINNNVSTSIGMLSVNNNLQRIAFSIVDKMLSFIK